METPTDERPPTQAVDALHALALDLAASTRPGGPRLDPAPHLARLTAGGDQLAAHRRQHTVTSSPDSLDRLQALTATAHRALEEYTTSGDTNALATRLSAALDAMEVTR